MIGVRVRVDGDAPVFLIPVGRLEEVGQQSPELLPRLSGEGALHQSNWKYNSLP